MRLMDDLERVLIETVSYTLDFKGSVLFCRLCGRVSHNAEDVKNRYCGNCNVFHDNAALEKWLERQSGKDRSSLER